jgi:hypothetical protein
VQRREFSRKHYVRRRDYYVARNLAVYGLTPESYRQMVEAQHGRCAICGDKGRLFVDHDHETGSVRGLLCSNCNTALGMFEDDLARIERAIKYLEGRLEL